MVPQVQDITQIMAELDPAYAQSRNLYNQQIGGVDTEVAGELAGLESSFKRGMGDIAKSANSRGLDFWGIPIEEQSLYNDKYVGAQGQVRAAGQKRKTSLQEAIAQLEQDRYKTAVGRRDQQVTAQQSWQRMMAEQAFEREQNALTRSASASQRASENVDLQLKKNKRGGWDVYENGRISTNYDLASAADALGKDLVSLLENGDDNDKRAAKYYRDNSRDVKRTGGGDAARALAYAKQQLRRDRGTAFYLGGAY